MNLDDVYIIGDKKMTVKQIVGKYFPDWAERCVRKNIHPISTDRFLQEWIAVNHAYKMGK